VDGMGRVVVAKMVAPGPRSVQGPGRHGGACGAQPRLGRRSARWPSARRPPPGMPAARALG